MPTPLSNINFHLFIFTDNNYSRVKEDKEDLIFLFIYLFIFFWGGRRAFNHNVLFKDIFFQKLCISSGRLAWWLLAFLHSEIDATSVRHG